MMNRTLDAIIDDRGAKPERSPVTDYVQRGHRGDKPYFTPSTKLDDMPIPSNRYEGAAIMSVSGFALANIGAVEYGGVSPEISSLTTGAIMGTTIVSYLCKGGKELYDAGNETKPIDDLPDNTSFSEEEPPGDAIQASYTVLD